MSDIVDRIQYRRLVRISVSFGPPSGCLYQTKPSKRSDTPSLRPDNPTNTYQLLHEIESQALTAQRDINVVKNTVALKQRDIRLLELTTTELKSLPKETKTYEGVGKMYGP